MTIFTEILSTICNYFSQKKGIFSFASFFHLHHILTLLTVAVEGNIYYVRLERTYSKYITSFMDVVIFFSLRNS